MANVFKTKLKDLEKVEQLLQKIDKEREYWMLSILKEYLSWHQKLRLFFIKKLNKIGIKIPVWFFEFYMAGDERWGIATVIVRRGKKRPFYNTLSIDEMQFPKTNWEKYFLILVSHYNKDRLKHGFDESLEVWLENLSYNLHLTKFYGMDMKEISHIAQLQKDGAFSVGKPMEWTNKLRDLLANVKGILSS